jgi:uncharacterized protein YjbI with pentapeptide repeats
MHTKKAEGKQMANQEHLDILNQGVDAWNQWRKEHAYIQPDLSHTDLSHTTLRYVNLSHSTLNDADLSSATLNDANLSSADLSHAKLHYARLHYANLYDANLRYATLSHADLRNADLSHATLSYANLNDANLRYATLSHAYFSHADLSHADLSHATLSSAVLVETNLKGATLTQCSIYGISAWNVQLEGAKQDNLIISAIDEPIITVDNLKIAQFIYLLLNNAEIREVIDTIAKKAVLILGRFTPERKAILDALKEALRANGYLPILFDFDKPASRDITETISTLAHLSRFVIADITDAKSIPQELMLIVPNLPSVPVQPLILESQHEYGMFEHFTRFPWVLPVYHYTDQASLLKSLQGKVITPAEQKAKELEER